MMICAQIFVFKDETPGGGGYSHFFSSYVGLDPASNKYPQNIWIIRHTPPPPKKKNEFFATPKNTPVLYIDLKKGHKMHINYP